MEDERKRIGKKLSAIVSVLVTAAILTCMNIGTAWAMDAGAYLVTVAPSYRDPQTGSVDDPGNNAAIGQGMTERMCGSTGLLEVENSGDMYLTVRYYLSQFIRDVSFEERIGGDYVSRSYQAMQSRAADESSGDIEEKYGYTDYRIPIGSMDSVFRGKAYIEAMGRNVADARSGSGDFVVSSGTAAQTAVTDVSLDMSRDTQTGSGQENTEVQAADAQTGTQISSGTQYVLTEEADAGESAAGMEEQTSKWEELAKSVSENGTDAAGDWINGSGSADDPVTGIPVKPTVQSKNMGKYPTSGAETASVVPSGAAAVAAASDSKETTPADYHLETAYNPSAVSMKDARKLTEPMLEAATGIAGIAGDLELAETPEAGSEKKELNGNKLVMTVLLGAAVLLFVWFAAAGAQSGRRGRGAEVEVEGGRTRDDRASTGSSSERRDQEQTGGEKGE
ncbi:MAG: hypothetical protein LUC94_14910 [Clostridiales bacterium]|nr:hypothetical protein [Clostridiales bacterium]